MKRKIKTDPVGDRGMTLVEILVAVAILAIIVTPLLHAFVTGANTERKTREFGEATAAAQALVEKVEATGAAAYLKSNGAVPDDPDAEDKTYTIEKSYSYNGRDYDAKLVFTAPHDTVNDQAVNDTSILVGNEMDIILDCTGIDSDIFKAYLSECLDMGWTDENIAKNNLTRKITLEASQLLGGGSYMVTATFNYNGLVYYKEPIRDEYDNIVDYVTLTKGFDRNVTSTGRCTVRDDPADPLAAFSLFLFYNPYLETAENLTLTNNLADKDVKLFLVATPMPGDGSFYHINIDVSKQFNRDISRVFSNLSETDVTYAAFSPGGDGVWKKTILSGTSLVETQTVDRFFTFTVTLYAEGEGYGDDGALVTIDSANLTDNPLQLINDSQGTGD